MYLHGGADLIKLGEYGDEVASAQHVTQHTLSQQLGRCVHIGHISHRHDRVIDTVVDDRVHLDSHGVLGEHLSTRTTDALAPVNIHH